MTPRPSPLHPARHRINVLCARGIVAAGLGMATLGGLLGAVPAVASPQLTSAQDRATQLRHTVDDLRVRTEQAAEAYDAAAAERAAAAAAAQVGQLLEQEAGVLAGAGADVVRIAEADRKAEQEAAERAFQAQLTAAQATVAQAARLRTGADVGSGRRLGRQPGVGVAPAATELGRAALAEAVRQIGKPYVWGAVGADSFDCSGLTQWAYAL